MSSPVARAVRGLLSLALVLAMLLTGFVVLAVAGLETGAPAFILALLLATLPVPLYLALVLWIDRFEPEDRKSTRLNSSHANISYAVFCLKKKNIIHYVT